MAKKTGISDRTRDRLYLGAGKLELNGTSVGATTGNSILQIRRKWITPRLIGSNGELLDVGFLENEILLFHFTLTEITGFNLNKVLPGTTLVTRTGSEEIGSVSTGVGGFLAAVPPFWFAQEVSLSSVPCIGSDGYFTLVWTGEDKSGDTLTIRAESCRAISDLELNFKHDDTASFNVTFRANYGLGDPDERPWQIILPVN